MSDSGSSRLGDVVFRPLRGANALEDTVARLMQIIRLGVVPPGQALPSERELALRFSVSRDTVREAIRELTGAGFLLARRGRYGGTFVSDPLPPANLRAIEPSELDDLLALRDLLEVGGARASAARALPAADRDRLWHVLQDAARSTPDDYRRRDTRLHLAIAEAAGIPSLVPLVVDSRARINELLDSFPLLPGNIEHSDTQHRAIVQAILAGQPDAAAAAMREHVAGSAALLRGFLG